MSNDRHFNLQLRDSIRPIVIVAETQFDAFRKATVISKEQNTQIISLIEMLHVDARRPKKR